LGATIPGKYVSINNGLRQMLEESLKLSTIGFAALNKDDIIAYANVAFCKMFDVATLNRTHSLKYLKGGLCINESRKAENLYG
jgi:hypothetical protein